jgi:predicted ATPase
MFIKSIHLKNILSFGENTPLLELQDLNILIGANGSGKSNLIDVIEVFQNAPKDIFEPINSTGGVKQWVWKKDEIKLQKEASFSLKFQLDNSYEGRCHLTGWNYFVSFLNTDAHIEREIVFNSEKKFTVYDSSYGKGHDIKGHPVKYFDGRDAEQPLIVDFDKSFFSQGSYLVYNRLIYMIDNIKIYRDWSFGRKTHFRKKQETSASKEFLRTDFKNLNLALLDVCSQPVSKKKVVAALNKINENYDDIILKPLDSDSIELNLFEGEKSIPATRLSDGTLRYLCLLAILCHPNPPPLICIEEPELGFHPDLLPTIADLLKDASTRTQLIITTHSDILIDCFSDTPEAVIVFDKIEGATTMTRLSKEKLKVWLNKYSLGKLWMEGHIGGLRW